MSSQQTTDSPQAKVLQSFVEGFRRRDVDLIASQLHNDHRHVFYPRSLGMSVHTREDYIRKAAMFMGKWADGSEVGDTFRYPLFDDRIAPPAEPPSDHGNTWDGRLSRAHPGRSDHTVTLT